MVFSSSPLRYILAKTQQITDENMGWMLDRHKNGNGTMDAEGAACAWLRSNEEKWDRWITPPPSVTRRIGRAFRRTTAMPLR